MNINNRLQGIPRAFAACLLLAAGCHHASYYPQAPQHYAAHACATCDPYSTGGAAGSARGPAPVGTQTDMIMMRQEKNAEASKYVLYQHEFELNRTLDGQTVGGWRLTGFGEDHLKQIAVNLKQGSPYPVIIERSRTSPRLDTKHQYPIHFNPELDRKRRRVVVESLALLGVNDADQRVVVAPALATPYHSSEAEAAYFTGLRQTRGTGGFGFGGFGGFGSGIGGLGGF